MIIINYSGMAQRLACLAHNQEVGGSNPSAAIINYLQDIILYLINCIKKIEKK